jgi:hypothetical protein
MSKKSRKAHRSEFHPSSALDPRDGPTAKFVEHHDVISRGGGEGKRVYSKIEMLLRTRHVTPEQSEAGRRFTIDYLTGRVGAGRSCLDMSASGGGGDGHPSMHRIEASGRVGDAKVALDAAKCHTFGGQTAFDILVSVCIRDVPFSAIATAAEVSDETAKSWIAQYLAVLTAHYEGVDKRKGLSTTAYTQDAALKRYDPVLD